MNKRLKKYWLVAVLVLAVFTFPEGIGFSGDDEEDKPLPIQIECNIGLRTYVADLTIGIDPIEGYLEYELRESMIYLPEDRVTSGSNRLIAKAEERSSTSVKISTSDDGSMIIEAEGSLYNEDQERLAQTAIHIELTKLKHGLRGLGTHTLHSFEVEDRNFVQHSLSCFITKSWER